MLFTRQRVNKIWDILHILQKFGGRYFLCEEHAQVQDASRKRIYYAIRNIILFFLFFASLLFLIKNHAPVIDLSNDGAEYYSLSEAMARGAGYRHLFYPDHPVNQFCPIGLPLLGIPFCLLWPGNLLAPQAISMAFYLFLAPLVFLFVAKKSNLLLGLMVAVYIGANRCLADTAQYLGTDLPFLVLAYAMLGLLISSHTFQRAGRAALYFLLYAFAALVRAAHLVFIPITFLTALLKKKYYLALLAILIPWMLKFAFAYWITVQSEHSDTFGRNYSTATFRVVKQMFPGDNMYLAHLKVMLKNIPVYMSYVNTGLFNTNFFDGFYNTGANAASKSSHAIYLFYINLFYPLITLGLLHQIKRKNLIVEVFFFSYLALILIYPYCALRYLFPIFPLLFYYALEGMLMLWEVLTWKLRDRRLFRPVALLLLCIMFLPFYNYYKFSFVCASQGLELNAKKRSGELPLYSPGMNAYVDAAFYMKSSFKPYEVTIAPGWNPMLFGVLSTQTTVPVNYNVPSLDQLVDFLKGQKVKYFVFMLEPTGNTSPSQLKQFLPDLPRHMTKIHEVTETNKGYSTQIWELK